MKGLLPLALLGASAAAASPPDEKPFPVPDRSMILREEGAVYTVEGRIRIPRGVEVSCQKDIHIRATGSAPAVIEVEGSFKAHGTRAREIIFEGVTVEPAADFGKIQLDGCKFRKGGGLRTPKGKAASGDLSLLNVGFADTAALDLSLEGPSIEMSDCNGAGPIRLRGVDGAAVPNRLKATVRGCTFWGMEAENVADLTVRLSTIRAGTTRFQDCGVLVFDGSKVEAKEISFLHSKAGGLSRTQVMKCDLYSKRIVFRAPVDPKRSDDVVLDKCWFEGETDPAKIAGILVDGADEPENNARASVTNPQKRPLELAGDVNR